MLYRCIAGNENIISEEWGGGGSFQSFKHTHDQKLKQLSQILRSAAAFSKRALGHNTFSQGCGTGKFEDGSGSGSGSDILS